MAYNKKRSFTPWTIEQAKRYIAGNIAINDNGCHIWQRSKTVDGYGQISIDALHSTFGIKGAHRLALFLETGIKPASRAVQVLHSCDVRACCSPSHLRWGTASENTADMIERGRCTRPRGEASARSKLTESDVRLIRMLLAAPLHKRLTHDEIGVMFGVRGPTISNIRRGITWAHLQ